MNINLDETLEMPSAVTELDELATKLWQKYFKPDAQLNTAQRRSLMNQYNLVAKRRNELSGHPVLLTLTPSTRFEWKPDHEIVPPGVGTPTRIVFNSQPQKQLDSVAPARIDTGGPIIKQIIALHVAGKTNAEIIAMGFNRSTVSRQVGEYKKRQQ